jgi:hypothetical protein
MNLERIIWGFISSIIGIILFIIFYKNKSKENSFNIGKIMEYKGIAGAIGFIILGIILIVKGILGI